MQILTLDQVLTFHRGITFKPDDKVPVDSPNSIVCLRTKNIQSELDESDLLAVPRSFVKRDELLVRRGDILISSANSWDLVGKCVRITETKYESTLGGFISLLRPNIDKVDPDYLYRFISMSETQSTIRHMGKQTTNISNLDRVRFLEIEIPLPPLLTQKQIAAILEKSDQLRKDCQQMEQELNNLAQSVFIDMFGDPVSNPKGWRVRTIGEIAEKVTDGEHQTPNRSDSGYKLLSARNIQHGYLDVLNEKVDYIGEEEFQRISKRLILEKTDVLLSCSGTIGRASMNTLDEPFCLVRSAAVIRVNKSEVLPEFLVGYLGTAYMQSKMSHEANSSGQPNLFQNQIKKLDVFLPPLAQQELYCKYLKAYKRQVELTQANHKALSNLFNSLMQKAFNGELNLNPRAA